mmetsp:Transcript_12396/g.24894  ORF Transcript_12396/g.24894 Transcript_12396/m.24894 type:complete len:132 (-) Transcript_12396:374-769(-)
MTFKEGAEHSLFNEMNLAVAHNSIDIAFAIAKEAVSTYEWQAAAEGERLGCFLPVYPSGATEAAVQSYLSQLYDGAFWREEAHRLWHKKQILPQWVSRGSYASRCAAMLQSAHHLLQPRLIFQKLESSFEL